MSRAPAVLLAILASVSAAGVRAAGPFEFDRPGIGFATSVLAPGDVALEQGLPDVERDRADGVRTHTLTFGSLLRVGLGASLEVQLAGEPHVRSTTRTDDAHARVQGAGDASVGVKWRLPAAGDLDWALLAQYGLRTGSQALRPERHARSLAATVGGETRGGRGYAVFAGYTRDDDGGGWRLSPSLTLFDGETVSSYVEAAVGTGSADGVVAGAGLTWQPRDAVQLDVSVLRGLDDAAADWAGGVGISVGFR